MIKLSTCSINELGKTTGGKSGDQTGKEYYVREYYNGGWNYILRHPNTQAQHQFAKLANDAANNDNIGYDQSDRLSFWSQLVHNNYDPKKISVPCSADCSSSTSAIIRATEIILNDRDRLKATFPVDATTRNLRIHCAARGYQVLNFVKKEQLQPGDILLKEGSHVVIVVSTDVIASSQTEDKVATIADEVKKQSSDRIRALQQALNDDMSAGLAVDGIVGPKTMAAMDKVLLKKGSKGALVRLLQTKLIVSVDGDFGPNTEAAVKSYQSANGLTADGIVGKKTMHSMFG